MVKEFVSKLPLAKRAYGRLYCLHYLRAKYTDGGTERSYSQFGEDVIAQKYLGSVNFFIDIGASGGQLGSNTFYFAIRGAGGICFEPRKEAFRRLQLLYLLNRRVECVNCGISDHNMEANIVEWGDYSYICGTEDPCHSAVKRTRGRAEQKVGRIRLMTFREATGGMRLPTVVDLLSIDVEGHELNVLRSIPFGLHHFRLVIVETHLLDGNGEYVWKHRDIDAMFELLRRNGYEPLERTKANTLFSPKK